MKFVADLHIHSHYSRATSKNLNFEHLTKWAQLKGIHVVGTGDIAHPGWLQEMKAKLEPAEAGLFQLKDEYAKDIQREIPAACQAPVRFMLAGEISSIYKKNDKVRKVHNVIFAPTLAAVEKIQVELEKIGNIRSDGRPILGLDSRDLLEITLKIDPQNYLIPAHIWTPWFSLLGSKSGFDSVEECFEDLTPHIFALETGLSSDPPMNWRISALDRYTLVSNSDAHSPQKLAREANLFNTELSYPAIFAALKTGDPEAFLGTVEFFPEEGKYHYDGHRKCGIRWTPKTTLAYNGICPECGKKVTIGVMHRVETLADREEGARPARSHPYHSLIPLPEILGEVYGVGPNSKKVQQSYDTLLAKLGSELSILQDVPLEEVSQAGGPLLAEGIRRMRKGEVITAAGYDGEYGVIKVFDEGERDSFSAQLTFFPAPEKKKTPKPAARSELSQDPVPKQRTQATLFSQSDPPPEYQAAKGSDLLSGLNPQQREAVLCTNAPLIIVAGPGTGKTRTLTYRIAYLITEKGVRPENILAITFTNKAAEEMAQRLRKLLGADIAGQIVIKTFHAFGAMILREDGEQVGLSTQFAICSDQDRQVLLKQLYPDWADKNINRYLEQISTAKNQLLTPDSPEVREQYDTQFIDVYGHYQAALQKSRVLDFDDLIARVVNLFETDLKTLEKYQHRFRWISVDEYQDINFAQYRLLRLLTPTETNLCAIGDPDQAIYGFRGADRTYFLQFQQDFPQARTLHLNQNYRSTQLILDASAQIIVQSQESTRLEIWSEFLDETKLDVYSAATDKAEAEYVVHEIEKLVGGLSYFSLDSGRVDDDAPAARSFADFAVLYRLNAQNQPLVEAFDRSGIPYQTVGQTPLYEYKDIKQLLAYLWFVHNPNSAFHLDTMLGLKNPEVVNRLMKFAERHSLSLGDALQQFEQLEFLTTAHQRRLRQLVPFLIDLQTAAQTQPVTELIARVSDFATGGAGKSTGRIEQLTRRAAAFGHNLPDFLAATVLQKETDAYDPRADRVTLMTLHAAKGLEFPVVFIVGCEEGLLPYQQEGKTFDGQTFDGQKNFDLEEERRLFYVGMTRAQHKLILTHAKSRFLFGQKQHNLPSRFLSDIKNTLKEVRKMKARKSTKEKPDSQQLKLF